MKTNVFFILLLILSLNSCLDPVEVDLEEATPRIVIDATLVQPIGQGVQNQTITISRTRDFFEDEPQPLEGASVRVINEQGQEFEFTEIENPGEYVCFNLFLEQQTNYFLEIEIDNQFFSAEERLEEGIEIDEVEQSFGSGFSNDEFQVRAFFTDDGTGNNFYLFKFLTDFLAFPNFTVLDDEFISGNTNSVTFSDEELVEGETVFIQLHKISEGYYNFLQRLLAQVGAAGGPFQAQPSIVRGNIINESNPDDFVFGYFSISEYDEVSITIEPEND